MILVDSSVWIDFFGASPGPAGKELYRMISEAEPLALAGVVITEVLRDCDGTLVRSNGISRCGKFSNPPDIQLIVKPRMFFDGRGRKA